MSRKARQSVETRKPETASVLYIVGEEGLLFAPASRHLYWLNTTATYIWCCYEEGMKPLAIADALVAHFGATRQSALQDIVQTVSEWKAKGLLDAPIDGARDHLSAQYELGTGMDSSPPVSYLSAHSERHYRLLDLDLRIRYSCEETASLVHPVFAHLETPSCSAKETTRVVFQIAENLDGHGYAVFKDGILVGECHVQAELAPMIQREALLAAYEEIPCLLAIHSAAVCDRHGNCVLMPAAKGSGKSTLTAALLASGYTYLTDELCLLTLGSHHIRPAPVSLGLKRGAWPLLASEYPNLENLPTHLQCDDVQVKYLTPPKEQIASQDVFSVTHIVFPRYKDGMSTALTQLSHAEALWRIAEGGSAVPGQLDKAHVEGLIEWITPLPCYELRIDNLGDAVREMEALLR